MCLMAISIISVFSTRPRPFFIYSAGMSRDRSARQLFIRSRRRFSIIRCDIGSCRITRKIINALFVYIFRQRINYYETLRVRRNRNFFHTTIIVLSDLNTTRRDGNLNRLWSRFRHFVITRHVLITSSYLRTPRDEQTSWAGAITLSRSCSFVSRIRIVLYADNRVFRYNVIGTGC